MGLTRPTAYPSRVDFAYVGAGEEDAPYRSNEVFALLVDKPGKDTKAGLKSLLPPKAKLSFHARCARLTLPRDQPNEEAALAFWSAAHAIAPTVFVLRVVRGDHRTRSEAHRVALAIAEAHLEVFEPALAAARNSITRQLGLHLIDELAIVDLERAWRPPFAEHATAALHQRHLERVRWMGMGLVNEPSTAVALIRELTWDVRDAIAMLHEIAERIACWAERLDAEREEAALWLARQVHEWGVPDGPEEHAHYHQTAFGNALFVALKAAMQAGDAPLAKIFRGAVRAHGASASANLVLSDLRRHAGDPRFNQFAEEVLQPGAETLLKVAHWIASRDAAIALELYERLAALPDPHWHVANNGVAMLLTVHPGKVPKAALARWRERIENCGEAPARHNLACLLARIGELDAAKAALLEAIEGGADLDPIVTDAELRALLDDPDVVAALHAATPDKKERRRLDRLRRDLLAG